MTSGLVSNYTIYDAATGQEVVTIPAQGPSTEYTWCSLTPGTQYSVLVEAISNTTSSMENQTSVGITGKYNEGWDGKFLKMSYHNKNTIVA